MFHPLNSNIFIRDEIAGCIEKAYHRIGLSEAARMLFFDSQKPIKDYAAKVTIEKMNSFHYNFVMLFFIVSILCYYQAC